MSDDWKPGVVFSELSDIGMRRANNQDAMASLPAQNADRFRSRGHLFVVADGMGAHAAGELASRMATENIAMNYFRTGNADPIDALRAAVIESNAEIHRRGQQNPEFHNMGTTASSLVLLPIGAVVAHVGDSRVYRLRNGVLEQLTFDHSLVWEMEASGQVHPESALSQSIPKNVITRSLGPNAEVEVDVEGPFPVKKEDRFLLCSDGLTGLVDDAEIGTLMDCLPEELATRVLVDLANLRGGPDNTTVIIVRISEAPSNSQNGGVGGSVESLPISPLVLISSIVCLVAAIVLGLVGQIGLMVVAVLLGLVASGFGAAQLFNHHREIEKHALPKVSGGNGPYRRYDAKATSELYQCLGATVEALRDAASDKNWMMNWKKIDEFQRQGAAALDRKDPKGAIRHQAEAIIETMNQLREQNNRAANETAIDY
ncbi:MAG: protein phosphatase 2C domain-containing protein [Pirellulales bacterium]|nr:protein phosphatase 2C domain-containing protein [Pirellulales bacterium]